MNSNDQELLDWVKSEGAKVEGVMVGENQQGIKGLIADTELDHIMLCFPRRLMVTHRKVIGSRIGRKIKAAEATKHIEDYYAAFLLQESNNPESFWAPYFRSWPKDYSEFPLLYSDEMLSLLDDSGFKRAILSLKDEHEYRYQRLIQVKGFKYSQEEYFTAMTQVMSRSFSLRLPGKKEEKVMIPFADMANHDIKQGPHSYYGRSREKGNGYVLLSERKFQPGDEFCINYGSPFDRSFELSYGFSDSSMDDHPLLTSGFLMLPDEMGAILGVEEGEQKSLYLSNAKAYLDKIDECVNSLIHPEEGTSKYQTATQVYEELLACCAKQKFGVQSANLLSEETFKEVKAENTEKSHIYDMLAKALVNEVRLLSFLEHHLCEKIEGSSKSDLRNAS